MDQVPPRSTPPPREVLRTETVRVVEYALPPGTWQRWHHHSEVTDRFYGLEGSIAVEQRDPPAQDHLGPGETLSLPPGTVHRAGNPGTTPARYLLVQGIGRYDFIAAT